MKIKLGLLIVVIILATSSYWYLKKDNSPTILNTGTLSPRAQEFVATQNADGAGMWMGLSSSTPAQTSEKVVGQIDNECFSFKLPLPVVNPVFEHQENRCHWKAKVTSPLSQLIIAAYKGSNLSEDSGVKLRRDHPEEYQATNLSVLGASQAVLFRAADSVIAFAQYDQVIATVGFNGLSQPDLIDDEIIEQLLNSLQINSTSIIKN